MFSTVRACVPAMCFPSAHLQFRPWTHIPRARRHCRMRRCRCCQRRNYQPNNNISAYAVALSGSYALLTPLSVLCVLSRRRRRRRCATSTSRYSHSQQRLCRARGAHSHRHTHTSHNSPTLPHRPTERFGPNSLHVVLPVSPAKPATPHIRAARVGWL